MSQCNAYELLYWDTDRDSVGWKQTIGRQLADDQRDVKWHSWSSTLGFDVLGIWPPDYDNTDINKRTNNTTNSSNANTNNNTTVGLHRAIYPHPHQGPCGSRPGPRWTGERWGVRGRCLSCFTYGNLVKP